MLFMEVLAKNVMELQLQEGTQLTYVDTFTTSKVKNSGKNTGTTLNSLAKWHYKVSGKQAQISQPSVKYLGFKLTKGQRSLLQDCRQTVAWVTVPTTQRQLRGFLEWQDSAAFGSPT